jgi:hypothetical protein
MKFTTLIPAVLAMALVGCDPASSISPLDMSGNRAVACEDAREEILTLAVAQERFDSSATRSDDPEQALEEVWVMVAENGYRVIQKPSDWGPLSRYTQTLPFNVILLSGSWEKRSVVDKLATAEHEALHMFLELSMPREEFIRLYIGDAKFRAAIELAGYKISFAVARRHGRSASWEVRARARRVKLLLGDYLIGLALTHKCLTALSEEVWGPVAP